MLVFIYFCVFLLLCLIVWGIYMGNVTAERNWEKRKKELQNDFMEKRKQEAWDRALPRHCPRCASENVPVAGDGLPSLELWECISTQEYEEEKPVSATTFMYTTTINIKKQKKARKTYKCPKCGYIITRDEDVLF